MKKVIWIALIMLPAFAFAQDDDDSDKKFFRKENCFTGGGLNLSFGSNVTALGLNPHFGYTFFNFLEAAATLNFTYISIRDPYSVDKDRQTITSPGVFVRLFPVKFLFAHAQYEHSFIRTKYGGSPSIINHNESNSILVGGGFASGREPGEFYYYFSVLWDIGEDENSPNTDNFGRSIPLIRAGVNIPLFKGGGRSRD